MQHLKNTPETRVSHMDGDGKAGCENWMSSKAHGCRVQRAISLAVSVYVSRVTSRGPSSSARDPARHHCLFFLTSSRFCRPGILPMPCYHGYTVTGEWCVHKSIRPCSFLFATAGAHIEKRVARRFGMRDPLRAVAKGFRRRAEVRAIAPRLFFIAALFSCNPLLCLLF